MLSTYDHSDINAWSFSHAPTQWPVLSGASISAVSSLGKFHVMMRSSVELLMLSSDEISIRSLRVCASNFISDPVVFKIISWNWSSTSSKSDFIEMEYPVRDVAAFRSPSTILRCHSDSQCISAWMWVFTHLWRSGRPAVAWRILIILTRSASCVIASSHKLHPWAMRCSAFFSRGLCQFTTSAVGRNTRLCRMATTVLRCNSKSLQSYKCICSYIFMHVLLC